jgi:hypothetical protein
MLLSKKTRGEIKMTKEKFNGLVVIPRLDGTKKEFKLLNMKAKELFGDLVSDIFCTQNGAKSFTIIFESPDISDVQQCKIQELKNINLDNDFYYITVNADLDYEKSEMFDGGLHYVKQDEGWFEVFSEKVTHSNLLDMQVAELNKRGYDINNLIISDKTYLTQQETSMI